MEIDLELQRKHFRFILYKYPDRGLADDRFWFNGQMRLFETLFWITYAILSILAFVAFLAKSYLDEFYFENNIGYLIKCCRFKLHQYLIITIC